MLRIFWIEAVLDNFSLVDFNPFFLVRLPFYFKYHLGVCLVSVFVQVLELLTLEEDLKYPWLCLLFKPNLLIVCFHLNKF